MFWGIAPGEGEPCRFLLRLNQLRFELWHLRVIESWSAGRGYCWSLWLCGLQLARGSRNPRAQCHGTSQTNPLCFLQMDDNLRQSPQLPARKLPTLRLTPAEEDSNSQRLSP